MADNVSDMATLGDAIRAYREELGITQTELAERAGLQRAYLSQIESGRIALPGADVRRRIARAMDIQHVDLLVAAGELLPEEVSTVHKRTLTRHQQLLGLINLTVDNREAALDALLQLWMDQDRTKRYDTELVLLPGH